MEPAGIHHTRTSYVTYDSKHPSIEYCESQNYDPSLADRLRNRCVALGISDRSNDRDVLIVTHVHDFMCCG